MRASMKKLQCFYFYYKFNIFSQLLKLIFNLQAFHFSHLDQCDNFHRSEMTLNIRTIEFWCFKCTSDRQLVHIIFDDKKINIYTYIIKQICNVDVSFLSSDIIRAISRCDKNNKNWEFSKIVL